MKKLKLYLDTSVFSHLFADDAPDEMADTRNLWNDFIAGKYELFTSEVVYKELKKCHEPKRSQMFSEINHITLHDLSVTDEIDKLAMRYITGGVLGEKHFADCQHIAFAVIHNCDMIISWNFKHLVNHKTINGVKTINAINRYGEIGIYSPKMLLSGGNL